MCYHTALDVDDAVLMRKYHRRMLEETRGQTLPFPRTSAFARPWWPMITAEAPEVIGWKQWGLTPFWVKDAKEFLKRTPTYNAVSEEAYEKRSFKHAMTHGQRCLIPVTSFYEWQHRPVAGRKTPDKIPYAITLRNAPIFCLGGIYENVTYSILTRPAQTLMATIHNSKKRQPVIVPEAFHADWLNPALTEEEVMRICHAVEEQDLVAEEVVAI
ncbi:MAG: SOS response-associated peptidase [Flavobacteriales bacterium]